jgi:5-methylcytosine-specific restriction endonuclease McrA
MKRASLSRTKRRKIYDAAGGICVICDLRIQVGQAWHVDHELPLCLGGADDESNMRPVHDACHKVKTAEDIGRKAKADRQRNKHLGIKNQRTILAGRGFDGKPRRYEKER